MNKKVLLVEDNRALAENVADILRMEDYEVVMAEDGAIALSYLKTDQFDLVVTDIVMPNMDGIELIREIRKNEKTKHLPVIILSAKTTDETMGEGTSAGANLFLKKPCQTEDLLKAINFLMK